MTKIRADILVVGGGLVGLSQAIALSIEGFDVVVIEKTPYATQLNPAFDGRASAIAWSSHSLMRHIGIWKFLEAHAEPIQHIHVMDDASPARVHYDAEALWGHPFGYMIENRHMRDALYQRSQECGSLKLIAPTGLTSSETLEHKVVATLESGEMVEAALMISAEGRKSSLRSEKHIETLNLTYGQTAIVCTIQHEKPHGGLALERFLPIGPFAVLPLKDNRSCLVWTESEETAPMYLALPPDAFKAEIAERLGDYLGDFTLQGKPFSYPLTLLHAERYIDDRFALVGDSAHGIHPIAGQGVNVGFRDVAVLTEVLTDAARLGLDIGSGSVLERYERLRRFDGVSMMLITDGLNRLFSNDWLPFKLARRTGMAAVNALPVAKEKFTRYAMGMSGDLPKLLRDAA